MVDPQTTLVLSLPPHQFSREISQIPRDKLLDLIIYSGVFNLRNPHKNCLANYPMALFVLQTHPREGAKLTKYLIKLTNNWCSGQVTLYGDEALRMLQASGQIACGIRDWGGDEAKLLVLLQVNLARQCSFSQKYENKYRRTFKYFWNAALAQTDSPFRLTRDVLTTMCLMFREDISLVYTVSLFLSASARHVDSSLGVILRDLIINLLNVNSPVNPTTLLSPVSHLLLTLDHPTSASLLPPLTQSVRRRFDTIHPVFTAIIPHMKCDQNTVLELFAILSEFLRDSDRRSRVLSCLDALYRVQFCRETAVLLLERLLKLYKGVTDVGSKEAVLTSIAHLSRVDGGAELCHSVFENVMGFAVLTNLPRLSAAMMDPLNSWTAPFLKNSSDSQLVSVMQFIISSPKLFSIVGFAPFLTSLLTFMGDKPQHSQLLEESVLCCYNYIKSCLNDKSAQAKLLPLANITVIHGSHLDFPTLDKCGLFSDRALALYRRNEVTIAYQMTLRLCRVEATLDRRSTLYRFASLLMFHRDFDIRHFKSPIAGECACHLGTHVCQLFDSVGRLKGSIVSSQCILVPSRFRLVLRAVLPCVADLDCLVEILMRLTHPVLYNKTYLTNSFDLSLFSPQKYADLLIANVGSEAALNIAELPIDIDQPIVDRMFQANRLVITAAVSLDDCVVMEYADGGKLNDVRLLDMIRETNRKRIKSDLDEDSFTCCFEGVKMTEAQLKQIHERMAEESSLAHSLHEIMKMSFWTGRLLGRRRNYIRSDNLLPLFRHSRECLGDNMIYPIGMQMTDAIVRYAFPRLTDSEANVVSSFRNRLDCCRPTSTLSEGSEEEHALKTLQLIQFKEVFRWNSLIPQSTFCVFVVHSIVRFKNYQSLTALSIQDFFRQPLICLFEYLAQIKSLCLEQSQIVNDFPVVEIIEIGEALVDGYHMLAEASRLLEVAAFLCELKEDCPPEMNKFIQMLMSDNQFVRLLALETLLKAPLSINVVVESHFDLSRRLCSVLILLMHWPLSENVRKLSQDVFELSEFGIDSAVFDELFGMALSENGELRKAASKGLRYVFGSVEDASIRSVFTKARQVYVDNLPFEDNRRDSIVVNVIDRWYVRHGVGLVLLELGPFYGDSGELIDVLSFTLSVEDSNSKVVDLFFTVSIALVDLHGQQHVEELLPFLNKLMLDSKDGCYGRRHVMITIMGSLAKHLEGDDPRTLEILENLISVLPTPSQMVQENIARCLSTLTKSIRGAEGEFVERMRLGLMGAAKYNERRGFAYGMAGFCKGLGISSIKKYDVLTFLSTNLTAKDPIVKENATFALEALCRLMGKLFEPYIVTFLPNLLVLIGDQNTHVRKAAMDCANVVMSILSSHGMKQILPKLLEALGDRSWRTRAGSIEIIGTIAHGSAQMMSQALPQAMPKLLQTLNDITVHVREAAVSALNKIGSVIKNPEITRIVKVLISALVSHDQIHKALTTLSQIKFVHAIDSPSLSIIIPVIQLGFREQNHKSNFMSALIFSRLSILSDVKDLRIYIEDVLPHLRACLKSLSSDVRGMTAKAFSTVAKTVENSDEALGWLYGLMTSKESIFDRQGGARGYYEMVKALGADKMSSVLGDVVDTIGEGGDVDAVDGCLRFLMLVPFDFPTEIRPHIPVLVASIVQKFCDDSLRESALQTLMCILRQFSGQSLELIVPHIEESMLHPDKFIRMWSTHLIGQLFCQILGISAEDDVVLQSTKSHFEAISFAMGDEILARVMAILFIDRFDSSPHVVQAAVRVWRIGFGSAFSPFMVTALTNVALSMHVSGRYHHMANAYLSAFTEICKRIPKFASSLGDVARSDDLRTRAAFHFFVGHALSCLGRDQAVRMSWDYFDMMISGFTDSAELVRESTLEAFTKFYSSAGNAAIESVLPSLLRIVSSSPSSPLVSVIGSICRLRPYIFPQFVVPLLCGPQVNLVALLSLSRAITINMSSRSGVIMRAITDHIARSPDPFGTIRQYTPLMTAIEDRDTCQNVILFLTHNLVTRAQRLAAASFAGSLLRAKPFDSQFSMDVFSLLFRLLCDGDELVQETSWDSMSEFIKTTEADVFNQSFKSIRKIVDDALAGLSRDVPGLGLPDRGIRCFVPLFRNGLFSPKCRNKEDCTASLLALVLRCPPGALNSSAMVLVGAIIRSLIQNQSSVTRINCLTLIREFMSRSGNSLRPFLSQLRVTVCGTILDLNLKIRELSVECVHQSILLEPSPLIYAQCLSDSFISQSNTNVRASIIAALCHVFEFARAKFPFDSLSFIRAHLLLYESDPNPIVCLQAAKCLGLMLAYAGDEDFEGALETLLLSRLTPECDINQFRLNALCWVVRADLLRVGPFTGRIMGLMNRLKDDNHLLAAVDIMTALMRHPQDERVTGEFVSFVQMTLTWSSSQIRELILEGLTGLMDEKCLHCGPFILPFVVDCCRGQSEAVVCKAEHLLAIISPNNSTVGT